jgi:hypothetical protein
VGQALVPLAMDAQANHVVQKLLEVMGDTFPDQGLEALTCHVTC